jgi:hypothetical protein
MKRQLDISERSHMSHDVRDSTGRMSESDLQEFSGVYRFEVKVIRGFPLLVNTMNRDLSTLISQ